MFAQAKASLITIISIALLGPCAGAPGPGWPQSPPTEDSETLRLLISGELGGLWEGKSLIQPRGGLGDADRGLLGALNKAGEDPYTIPILLGNNLGRAVKADAQTSTSAFHGRRLGIMALDPRRELKSLWESRYREAGLDFSRCNSYIDEAKDGEAEQRKASLACDRELFIWLIEQKFRAVALGPGDFNDLSLDRNKRLAELRHYPFIASNIFVISERQYGCQGKDCNQADPFAFAKEIFPNDPFVLELPDGGFSKIEEIELLESKEAGQFGNPFHSRRMILKPGKTVASSTFEHIYRLEAHPAVQHAVRYGAAGRAGVSEGKLTWTWPTPLWPNTVYHLVVRWTEGPPSSCQLSTHELFTVASSKARTKGRSVLPRPPGLTLRKDREPYLRSHSTGGQNLPWVYPGVPVIDASRIDGVAMDVPLRILALLDEKYQSTLDRAPEDQGRGGIPIVNQIRIMPMQAAVEYWRNVMDLIESPKALQKLLAALHVNDAPPAYAAFKALCENEQSAWKNDEAWRVEKAAWKCLQDFVDGRRDCSAAEAPGSPLFDLRPQSVREAVSAFQNSWPVVLLAHAEKNRVRELADKITDVAMIVGQPTFKSRAPKGMAVVKSPFEPLQVFPEEFAGTLDTVELTFEQRSPWRLTETSRVRAAVLGKPLQLLFEAPGSDLQKCCNSDLTLLTKRAVVNEDRPLSGEASDKDRVHLREWLKLRMRILADAETAYLQQGVVDPEPLDWIRALRLILDGKPINVQEASIEQLAQVPGIDEALAREIKAYRKDGKYPIRTRADLKDYWDTYMKDRDPDFAAWSWVRWFIRDGSGPRDILYVNHPVFIDQFFRRLTFVNYHLWKVVMTEDQLKKLRKEVKQMEGIEEQGLDTAKKVKLHFKELGGKKPVTVALTSNMASENGPFSVLKENTVLRERIEENGAVVSLQDMVEELTHKDAFPQDPPRDWVEKQVDERDDRGAWTLSLNAAGLTFQQVGTTQDFMVAGVNDERTRTEEERRIGLKPEFAVVYRGARLDLTNTAKTDFETNRLGPNAEPNHLSDSWTLRSEMDFFWRERSRINFPIYTAVSLESQWRRQRQVVSLENFTSPLVFPLLKRKELLGEYGIAVTNQKKSNFFRFGFAFGKDFNRILSATVQHANPNVPAITGALNQVNTEIQQNPCANPMAMESAPPLPPPDTETCFRPTTPLAVSLESEDRLTYGFAFRGQYEVEFGEVAGGQKIKFTSKLTDGNFFFRRDESLPSQPRFRFLLSNEVTLPLFGNLSFVPGVEVFVFRNQGGDPNDPAQARQTFWSRRPFFRIDYKFDLKPAFMRLADGLRFRNK